MSPWRLTAADLVRVVAAVHVVVALLVLPDALTVGAGELIGGTPDRDCGRKHQNILIQNLLSGPAKSGTVKQPIMPQHFDDQCFSAGPPRQPRPVLATLPRSPSHLFSSERSWQLTSPLQRRLRSMHWRLSHWNSSSEQTGQSSSSLLSSHSE